MRCHCGRNSIAVLGNEDAGSSKRYLASEDGELGFRPQRVSELPTGKRQIVAIGATR